MIWIAINAMLTAASGSLIAYALYLQCQMRKLHKVHVTLGAMELSAEGDRMYWRNRALQAEAELRAMKAGSGSPRIRLP